MNWEIIKRQSWGSSSATDWEDLIPDLSATLQAVLDECVASGRTVLYVEMWPDTGRFICYPAAHPVEGALAERETEFFVQLSAPFWVIAWDRISSGSGDTNSAYEQLNQKALAAITSAYDACQTHDITLYAFEYEGTEGIAVITKEGSAHDSNRNA
jgi:hypothetical protein